MPHITSIHKENSEMSTAKDKIFLSLKWSKRAEHTIHLSIFGGVKRVSAFRKKNING